jgi:hypothetical protein
VRNVLLAVLMLVGPGVGVDALAADSAGERRGEIGLQLGVRLADSDIVPDDANRSDPAWGIQAAWAFNDHWALFGDLNFSTHESRNFCLETENCNALTPEAEHKVLTIGVERRFKPGAKGGRWVLGLATGGLDVEWNGVQLHNGILSLGGGRRSPLGPGVLRLWLRVETGMFPNTDNQFLGALDEMRQTSVVFLVGWSSRFGRRFED